MQVREWMSSDPVTVAAFTDVADARRLLRRYGIRHLPVVDRGKIVGVVSDRDVRIIEDALPHLRQARAATYSAAGRPAFAALGVDVAMVMSAPPHVIGPDEPIEAAARLMLSRRISALPVVDGEQLVGIITTTDCLLASLSPQQAAS